jgi:acyl dehydratase
MKLDGVAGRAFDPVEFVIGDRLSVQNWARALRTDDPAMLALGAARDAGWAGRPVPPVMYAFFLTLPNEILVDELGFVWGRTLAAGIKAESGRVAGEDEWVRGQTFADEAYEKPGKDGVTRQFLRLRTEFRDEDDRLVNRWQTLFIEKSDDPVSVPQPEGAAPAVEPAVLDAPRSPSPVIPADGQLPSRRIGPLDRLDFARISVSLDDPNLVHLDEAVAANAGFGNVIGSGGYVLGALYEVARQWAGMDRIRSLDMRQLVPFPQGVELCATGTVATDGDASGESRLATVDAVVTDAGGQTIGTGTISVQL